MSYGCFCLSLFIGCSLDRNLNPAYYLSQLSSSVIPVSLRHTRESGCLSQEPLMEDARRLRGHDGKEDARLHGHDGEEERRTRVFPSSLSHPRKRVSQSGASDGRCPSTRA